MKMNWRGIGNFLTGIMFFVVGGWLGQFSFTLASIYTIIDIFHSQELRIPFYTVNWAYGISWRTATYLQCEAAAASCTGAVPLTELFQFGIGILAISIVEVVWFYRLVRSSVRPRPDVTSQKLSEATTGD
jgi:hypothetical protein